MVKGPTLSASHKPLPLLGLAFTQTGFSTEPTAGHRQHTGANQIK